MFRQWLLLNPKIIVNCQMSCANGRGTCLRFLLTDSLQKIFQEFASQWYSWLKQILNNHKSHVVVQMYRHVNSFARLAKKLNHHLMPLARRVGVHDSGKWDPVLKLFLDVRNCSFDRYSKGFYRISSSYSHNDLVFCDNRQKNETSPYRVNFTFIIKSMSPFA